MSFIEVTPVQWDEVDNVNHNKVLLNTSRVTAVRPPDGSNEHPTLLLSDKSTITTLNTYEELKALLCNA